MSGLALRKPSSISCRRTPSPPPNRFQKSIEPASRRDAVSPLSTLSEEQPERRPPPSPRASPPPRKLLRLRNGPAAPGGRSGLRVIEFLLPGDGSREVV